MKFVFGMRIFEIVAVGIVFPYSFFVLLPLLFMKEGIYV